MSLIAKGVNTFYSKRFLRRAANQLRMVQWGQKRDLPKGEGKTIEFFKYNAIAASMSGALIAEGGGSITATTITGKAITAVIAEYGGYSDHTSLLKATHIDKNLKGVSALWGEHAGKVIDLLTAGEVAANGAQPFRCDGENTTGSYYFSGNFSSVTSTTVMVETDALDINSAFGDANHDLLSSVITITSGPAEGESRAITAYTTAAGTITVSPAFDNLPIAEDAFNVVSSHGIVSGDIITTDHIHDAMAILKGNGASPMEDGWYIGIMGSRQEAQLKKDGDWTNLMTNSADKSGAKAGMFTGKIGEWGGVRWFTTTQPFRFNSATTVGTDVATSGVGVMNIGTTYTNYSATANTAATFILGAEAFGVTTFKGKNAKKPGIIVKTPGSGDTSNPLNLYSTVGWMLPFKCKALNSKFAIQMWSFA